MFRVPYRTAVRLFGGAVERAKKALRAMVQRYAHLAPDHLWAAVEGLAKVKSAVTRLRESFDFARTTAQQEVVSVS